MAKGGGGGWGRSHSHQYLFDLCTGRTGASRYLCSQTNSCNQRSGQNCSLPQSHAAVISTCGSYTARCCLSSAQSPARWASSMSQHIDAHAYRCTCKDKSEHGAALWHSGRRWIGRIVQHAVSPYDMTAQAVHACASARSETHLTWSRRSGCWVKGHCPRSARTAVQVASPITWP